MTLRWSDLAGSDFFTWFGIHETNRAPAESGIAVSCAPGNFADFITLAFAIDAEAVVRRAELSLDRAWMEERQGAALATDLTKSFILAVGQREPLLQALGQRIELLVLQQPGMLVRPRIAPPLTPKLQRTIAPALAVYEGRETRADLTAAGQTLVLVNEVTEGTHRFRTIWTAPHTSRSLRYKLRGLWPRARRTG